MMPNLTEEQIKEIAEQIDIGFRSFWNRTTNEVIFVPDLNNNPYADTEFYEEELEKLEKNFDDYIEIVKPSPSDSYEIMANFTEQLKDNIKLKNELTKALSKRKPFREFKFIIDNSGPYRQEWFDFKNKKLNQWVSDKFTEAINEDMKNGCT